MERQSVLMQEKGLEHVNEDLKPWISGLRGKAPGWRPRGSIKRSWAQAKGNIRVFSSTKCFSSSSTGHPYSFYYAQCPWRNFYPNSTSKPPEHLYDRILSSLFHFCSKHREYYSQKMSRSYPEKITLSQERWQKLNTQQLNRMGLGPAFIFMFNVAFSVHLPPQSIFCSSSAIKHRKKLLLVVDEISV